MRWLGLGAGAGVTTSVEDGLTRFKKGWATGTRPASFCGRIFDSERYRELCRKGGADDGRYFPAYRSGEFA